LKSIDACTLFNEGKLAGFHAPAYTAHVLDVYDHYRFRVAEGELASKRGNRSASKVRWDGFLSTDANWQDKASRRMSQYFAGELRDENPDG
jgi:hypothetical protein